MRLLDSWFGNSIDFFTLVALIVDSFPSHSSSSSSTILFLITLTFCVSNLDCTIFSLGTRGDCACLIDATFVSLGSIDFDDKTSDGSLIEYEMVIINNQGWKY